MTISESSITDVETDLRIRDELHDLVDGIPCAELHTALRFLQYLRDEGTQEWHAEEAPIDDEPETEEERAAVEQGREDFRAGRTATSEEMRRELGIEVGAGD